MSTIKHNGLEYISKNEVDNMIRKRLQKLQTDNQRLKEKLQGQGKKK